MRQVGDTRRSDRGARARAAVLYGGTAVLSLVAPVVSRRLRRRFSAPVADGVVTGGMVLISWAVIAGMEQRFPFRRDWNRVRRDVGTDVADLVVSDGWGRSLAGALARPVQVRYADRDGGGPLGRLPLPARLVVLLAAFDLGHYTLHRMMHEGPGWRFHAAHHSPDRLYFLNATRFHPVEIAADGTQELLMLGAFGVDRDTRLAYNVFRGIFGQIQHANVDIDSGPLNRLLSTPERHRWHHSTDPAEGNTNYGAVTALWDELFGSSHTPDRDFDAELGNGDAGYPTDWVGQLKAPFQRFPRSIAAGQPT